MIFWTLKSYKDWFRSWYREMLVKYTHEERVELMRMKRR